MTNYTLFSYEEALNNYDQNVENLKDCCAKTIEDLTETFRGGQENVKNDQFLSPQEKSRMLRKRQEGFDKLKGKKEKQLKADVAEENAKKKDFIDQNEGFDYHCFTTLKEINKSKEEKLGVISQEIERKQEELARLQAEIEEKQQEVKAIKLDLSSIQTKTLYEAFFELDVKPKIEKVQLVLTTLVERHKNEYSFSDDFVDRTVRCLTKECKKQAKLVNYEGGKLKLSFDTVENWTKGESERLKDEVKNILEAGGFEVSKMKSQNTDTKEKNNSASLSSSTFKPTFVESSDLSPDIVHYLRERLGTMDKDDIQGRVDIIKQLKFSFANESAFIKQIETAKSEGVDLIDDIDKWLWAYIAKPCGIEPRFSIDKKQYFKVSLSCKQRNPRILMQMKENNRMEILCVAPHVDYDNILRGQTQNYFQTWKGDWTKKGKQGRKTGRA